MNKEANSVIISKKNCEYDASYHSFAFKSLCPMLVKLEWRKRIQDASSAELLIGGSTRSTKLVTFAGSWSHA